MSGNIIGYAIARASSDLDRDDYRRLPAHWLTFQDEDGYAYVVPLDDPGLRSLINALHAYALVEGVEPSS